MTHHVEVTDTDLNRITAGFDKILSASGLAGIAIMLLLSGLVFGLTVSRYILRINIPGLFDAAIYTLIVFPLLTAAYTLREGRHISVDVLTSSMSGKAKFLLNALVYLFASIFVVVLCWKGIIWLIDIVKNDVYTDGVFAIPKSILLGIMLFGSFLLLLQIYRVVASDLGSLSSELRGDASSKDSRYFWLPSFSFLAGLIAGVLIFVYVQPAVGIMVIGLVLLFSGMPVFLALGLIGVTGIYIVHGTSSLIQIPLTAYRAVSGFPLSCLPLFILGGLIMEGSGIAKDVFRFFEVWTGRFSTSTLMVTIAAGMIFCAISGSSSATTAVITGVAVPILISRGFDKGLSSGAVAASTVGTLIPPSIGYVVYCVLTGESIGQLFIAGLVPSFILFAFYFLYIFILGKVSPKSLYENRKVPEQGILERTTWKDRILSLKTALWGLFTPILILGGIYLGVYTPTEASAVLVVYAIFLSIFIKKVKWNKIIEDTLRSAVIASMILCIISTAYMFALVISQLRVAHSLLAYMEAANLSAGMVLLIIFVILGILGLFLDAAAVKVITLPIFYPVAMAAGINGLWFGVFYGFCNEIGLLTPPVGMNLFVIKGVSDIPLRRIIRGCAPFLVIMTLTLIIIYIFPELVTWLPATIRRN